MSSSSPVPASGRRRLQDVFLGSRRRTGRSTRDFCYTEELSVRIRKEAKGRVLAVKRRTASTGIGTATQRTSGIQDFCQRYFGANINDVSTGEVPPPPPSGERGRAMVDELARLLRSPQSQSHSKNANNDWAARTECARLVTNLAASMSTSTSTSSSTMTDGSGNENYYGYSWCDVLVSSDSLLRALLWGVDADGNGNHNQNDHDARIQLSEQCGWALGNLAGDSREARRRILEAGSVHVLVRAFRRRLQSSLRQKVTLSKHSNDNDNDNDDSIDCAAWCLSNLARGSETSALSFLAINKENSNVDNDGWLTPDDLAMGINANNGRSVSDVCWLLAYLTSREDEAVGYLLSTSESSYANSTPTSNPTPTPQCVTNLTVALARRLERSVLDMDVRTLLPCLRAVGNLATAAGCMGVALPWPSVVTNSDDVPRTVAQLLQGHRRCRAVLRSMKKNTNADDDDDHSMMITDDTKDIDDDGAKQHMEDEEEWVTVATEAAWVAGSILCGPFPTTVFFQEELVPSLCTVVVAFGSSSSSSKSSTSSKSTSGLVREATVALWNAVSSLDNSTEAVALLGRILGFSRIIPTLVGMVRKPDGPVADLDVALRLIDSGLRRLTDVRPRLEREGLVEALEQVCERASDRYVYGGGGGVGLPSSSSTTAPEDVAADLLDDFFSDEFADADVDVDVDDTASSNHGVYWTQDATAQCPTTTTMMPTAFDFDAGRGRGRGRGLTLPSWMTTTPHNGH